VALSGIGGDELFAGYPNFKNYYRVRSNNYLWDKTYSLRKFIAACIPSNYHSWDRYNLLIKSRDTQIESVYPVFRQILSEKTMSKLIAGKFNGSYSDTVKKILNENRKQINEFPYLSQYSIADYLGYTQNTLMKDTDQMAMSQSIEVRAPFFDLDLVKYMLNIKDQYKLAGQKKLLTDSMAPLLKGVQLHQQKRGFELPMDIWMRNQLKAFCQYKIESLAERPFMNSKEVMQFWNNFLYAKKDIRSTDVWVLVVLENWLEKNQFRS
jgi:asparagine synthase (glutamine-hydrolysing)